MPAPADGSAVSGVAEVPRTPLSDAARALLSPVLPPALLGHSLRTFLYGRAWALVHGVRFDEEGLLLASLFHDAGLCPPYKDARRAFQLNSGRALAEWLRSHGVDGARIGRLTDAVRYHFQPVPRWSRGPEAGLLHVGAYMDAIGLRAWSVREARRAIRRCHPPRGSSTTLFGLIGRSIHGPASCLGIVLPDLVDPRPRD